jgi:hypothetical protein
MRIRIIKKGGYNTETGEDLEIGQVVNWKKDRAERAITLGFAVEADCHLVKKGKNTNKAIEPKTEIK